MKLTSTRPPPPPNGSSSVYSQFPIYVTQGEIILWTRIKQVEILILCKAVANP